MTHSIVPVDRTLEPALRARPCRIFQLVRAANDHAALRMGADDTRIDRVVSGARGERVGRERALHDVLRA